MHRSIALLMICFVMISCSENKIVMLPEIDEAEITDIKDVSPAYIFYDEIQPDSTLLNRKNLIISTNWLVNIDKRLTLRQAIPHIQFLQDKKRNAQMHKNENAKNYFSCNDTSIKNLGFMDFTDITYKTVPLNRISLSEDLLDDGSSLEVLKKFKNINDPIQVKFKKIIIESKDKMHFNDSSYFTLNQINSKINSKTALVLVINSSLSFQEYITIKHNLIKLETEDFKIANHEIIYN